MNTTIYARRMIKILKILFLLKFTFSIQSSSNNLSNNYKKTNILPSTTDQQKEMEEYEKLPQIIFSPTGQLHAINKACMYSEDINDITSSLGIALKCVNENNEYCIIFVCTNPISPHLYHPFGIKDDEIKLDDNKEDNRDDNLWLNDYEPRCFKQIGENMISFVGGNAIHANILTKRILDISLHLYRTTCIPPGINSSWSSANIPSFTSDILAKKVADTIQLSTQSMPNDDVSPILYSSALLLAINECKSYDDSYNKNNIWRIDPTGQFWNCDVGIVGRGSSIAQSILLREIQNKCKESNDNNLSNNDVHRFLKTLSINNALSLVCNCIKDTLKLKSDDNYWLLLSGIVMCYDEKSGDNNIQFLNGLQLKERIATIEN